MDGPDTKLRIARTASGWMALVEVSLGASQKHRQ